MRVAKWHCPFCGERFIWNDDDNVDNDVWTRTIWSILGSHIDRCSGIADMGDFYGKLPLKATDQIFQSSNRRTSK